MQSYRSYSLQHHSVDYLLVNLVMPFHHATVGLANQFAECQGLRAFYVHSRSFRFYDFKGIIRCVEDSSLSVFFQMFFYR
jgi:hypothetical protein